jgi:hypothetical protein
VLSQILKERARQFEIRGFEAFREAVVHESQRMPGLIALAAFAEQAGQGHRRPQLQGERRLRACDSERISQAVHGCFTVKLCRENLRLNPKQFGQVQFHSTICRARNASIDREQRLLELPGLAQAFRQCADEARDQEIVLLSAQGLQRAPQQTETGFRLTSGNGKFAFQRDAGGTVRLQRVSSGVHDQLLDEVAGAWQIPGPQ